MLGIPIRYSLRSLTHRLGRSALTIAGVAVAVFVSVVMIGLSRGLVAGTHSAAAPENVIVLSVGAESMEFSAIEPSDYQRFRGHSSVATMNGEPLSSPEVYVGIFVAIPGGETGEETVYRGILRGIRPQAFLVHDQVRITDGRQPSDSYEIITGRLAATKLSVPDTALAIGEYLEFEGSKWRIVGHFEAPGTPLESEIWAGLDDVMTAGRRRDYSLVTLKALDHEAAEDLVFDLNMRTDVRLTAQTEPVYYAAEADRLRPITLVSQAVTVMLVLAAMMAAMNTMFTSILGRGREMAILMIRGYRRRAVLATFLLESLFLCLLGAIIGGLPAMLLNELPMRVPMGAFHFAIDYTTFSIGLLLGALIGIVGAIFPLLHVARRPVVEAISVE